MKYAWIEQNKLLWPVCVQCRVLGVSVSGYRQHRARRKKILARRHLSETALVVEIRAVYSGARGAYGWPRVWRQLNTQGVHVGKLRVQRAMQQALVQRIEDALHPRLPKSNSVRAASRHPKTGSRSLTAKVQPPTDESPIPRRL